MYIEQCTMYTLYYILYLRTLYIVHSILNIVIYIQYTMYIVHCRLLFTSLQHILKTVQCTMMTYEVYTFIYEHHKVKACHMYAMGVND